jgi:thiamine biosynthesis protein ThiI
MAKAIIVRYGELALKSEKVRGRFERRLIGNIELSLRGLKYRIRRERGRIFVDTSSAKALDKFTNVPGIVSVSIASKTNAALDAISKAAVDIAKRTLGKSQTFAVRASRIGVHDFSSKEVNEVVGSAVLKAVHGSKVNLSHPDRTIFVEIRGSDAYIFAEKRAGVGGLPVGTQGKVVTLLSHGIDGPIATYLMMKRGCIVFPIFFYNESHMDKCARNRAVAIAKKLADFHPKLELRVVPFGEILREFVDKAPRELTCVLCKRAMLRIANIIAEQVKAEAIATGESLEQIAGQTLANLMVIDDASELPVLRPLVGMNNVEIEKIARSIGAFGISIKPAAKCSAASPYPKTYANLEKVVEAESRIDIVAMIKLALAKSKVIHARG